MQPFIVAYKKEISEALEFKADIVKGIRKGVETTVSNKFTLGFSAIKALNLTDFTEENYYIEF